MTFSQKVIAAFLFAVLPVAYACKTSEVALTNRVALKAYQYARLQNDVTVRVDSLNDSRCPLGANCIWAGSTFVKATLTKDADQKQVRLALGPDTVPGGSQQKSDSVGVILSGATYKVILRDVTPYPSLDQPSSPATQAIIEVTKL
ncbi:MAG: hypothetical protein EOO39_15390 [Cytophagaceae bacterium]|nr:MAG: hypothetical protein EOO39_15390 [Cytophagaceae bacterium]